MAQRCLPFELLLSVMFLEQEFSFPKQFLSLSGKKTHKPHEPSSSSNLTWHPWQLSSVEFRSLTWVSVHFWSERPVSSISADYFIGLNKSMCQPWQEELVSEATFLLKVPGNRSTQTHEDRIAGSENVIAWHLGRQASSSPLKPPGK